MKLPMNSQSSFKSRWRKRRKGNEKISLMMTLIIELLKIVLRQNLSLYKSLKLMTFKLNSK